MTLPSSPNMLDFSMLATYWSAPYMEANILIGLNLLGALILGMLVGYERSYNGRAAGMRTYGLVCMASAALTIFSGYPEMWFGGHGVLRVPDPTRVVQGIVSGIGFLCGGIIMKDGLSISGLTSAASLWTVSAIGILVGVGFYGAALTMALLSVACMSAFRSLRKRLPVKRTLSVTLKFAGDTPPDEEELKDEVTAKGYAIHEDGMSVYSEAGAASWRFILIAAEGKKQASQTELAKFFSQHQQVISFSIEPRN